MIARRWLSVYVPRHCPSGKDAVYEIRDADVQCILDDPGCVMLLRKRLGSLSWFMKALNEHIACMAKKAENNLKKMEWGKTEDGKMENGNREEEKMAKMIKN